jgi:uncharacterized protein
MLVVAVARLGFDTSTACSLKDKRKIVKSMIDRVRRRFPVSMSEIESNDNHSQLIIGLSIVSNSQKHATSMIDKIVDYIDRLYLAPMVLKEREIFHFGPLDDPFWDEKDDDISWDNVIENMDGILEQNTVPKEKI